MFNFKNPFKPKSGVPDISENFNEDKKEENKNEGMEIIEEDEKSMEGMEVVEDEKSFEEEVEELAKKKEEIKELQEKRMEYYNNAKQFEEKMASFGLSDEKKEEIRNRIMKEGGEISDKIQNIRDEYGLEASPVEVYSARFEMLKKEADRIKENLNLKYRDVKNYINNNGFFNFKAGQGTILMHVNHLTKKFPDVEEVKEFVDSINKDQEVRDHYNFNNKSQSEKAYFKRLEHFVNTLDQKIDEGSTYKTPGEVKDAEERLAKVNKMLGLTEEELDMAKAKMGRFEK